MNLVYQNQKGRFAARRSLHRLYDVIWDLAMEEAEILSDAFLCDSYLVNSAPTILFKDHFSLSCNLPERSDDPEKELYLPPGNLIGIWGTGHTGHTSGSGTVWDYSLGTDSVVGISQKLSLYMPRKVRPLSEISPKSAEDLAKRKFSLIETYNHRRNIYSFRGFPRAKAAFVSLRADLCRHLRRLLPGVEVAILEENFICFKIGSSFELRLIYDTYGPHRWDFDPQFQISFYRAYPKHSSVRSAKADLPISLPVEALAEELVGIIEGPMIEYAVEEFGGAE